MSNEDDNSTIKSTPTVFTVNARGAIIVVHREGDPNCRCPRCEDFDRAMELYASEDPAPPVPPPVVEVPIPSRHAPPDPSTPARATTQPVLATPSPRVPPSAPRPGHHRPDSPTNNEIRDAFAAGPFDEDDPNPAPNQHARTAAPSAAAAAASAPSASTALALTVVHQATVPPQGQYAQGFQGPSSVFKPKAYGLNKTAPCVPFLNELSKFSGVYRFEHARDDINHSGPFVPPPQGTRGLDRTGAIFDQAVNMMNASLSSIGVDTSQATSALNPYLSRAVYQCLLEPLRSVGMHNVAAMTEYMVSDGNDGLLLRSNPKHNYLFTPVMIKKDQVSTVNSQNETEVFMDPSDGEMKYNRFFWRPNMECKRLGFTGTNFWTLDIGFHQPMWTIPEVQQEDHVRAMKAMKELGPAAKNASNIFLMTLKQYYAHLFLEEMETQLTAKAILAGFRPLFLIKNCLLQKTKFGINNHQFSTMDKQPKSYLRLCAYFKGSEKNGDLCVIPIANEHGRLLSLKSS